MYEGCTVVDSDAHVIEPRDLWDTYIDAEFHDRRPVLNPNRIVGVTVDGRYMPAGYVGTDGEATEFELRLEERWRETLSEGIERDWSADFYLDALAQENIDAMVLNPTNGLYATAVDDMDPRLASAINRAYSRWVADFCSAAPDRLIANAPVSLHDPANAISDVEYVVNHIGLKAVVISPNTVNGRRLDSPELDDFFGTVAALGVPLALHDITGGYLPQYGSSHPSRLARHVFSHTVDQMGAMYALTAGGILHRHPGLRVSICETGAGWLPYWLDRLDQTFEFLDRIDEGERHSEAADLDELPSAYFRRQGWINVEPTEPSLRATVDYLGSDRILWSSKFPVMDSAYPGMVRNLFIAENEGLSKSEMALYAGLNAMSLYGVGGA
ncbi:MAG: amidohydrolase family protein [Acidimicrobiales bacterium]